MPDFSTTLIAGTGKNASIVVPDQLVRAFERGKRVPVKARIDGDYSYTGTIASTGGQYQLGFNAEARTATGKSVGDEVSVSLELDEEPRTVEIPEPLAVILAADPVLLEAWDALSYARQHGHVELIISARGVETRERRIEKVIRVLREQ